MMGYLPAGFEVRAGGRVASEPLVNAASWGISTVADITLNNLLKISLFFFLNQFKTEEDRL